MARPRAKNSLILRTSVNTQATNYQSTQIDIASLVDVPKGEVLLVKRAWITFNFVRVSPPNGNLLGGGGYFFQETHLNFFYDPKILGS